MVAEARLRYEVKRTEVELVADRVDGRRGAPDDGAGVLGSLGGPRAGALRGAGAFAGSTRRGGGRGGGGTGSCWSRRQQPWRRAARPEGPMLASPRMEVPTLGRGEMARQLGREAVDGVRETDGVASAGPTKMTGPPDPPVAVALRGASIVPATGPMTLGASVLGRSEIVSRNALRS